MAASCFQLTSVGEITAYFRTFVPDRKQVDFGQETAVLPLVPIQEKSVAKQAVLSLKNKRKMAFLPFKRQFFCFQAVRYAAQVSDGL